MHVLVLGALGGALLTAAQMAAARGAKLWHVDTAKEALTLLRRDAKADLLLVELPHDVAGLVQALAAERFVLPVVAAATDMHAALAVRAIREGAREFLPLPPDPELIAAILAAAGGESHALIARDPAMLAALARAEQVAASEASILITGESGTGKELMARHLHRRSRRSAGPFVAMNCAAIPDALLESELFGHEKGAFSGAVARRAGKFEAADGGTILLDEITEMELRLQAKLLRVIQEREVDRLGGTGPVRVNVRVLATSNRDLATEVAAGRFRDDLYFRLNVVSLHIPALRDRPADIPALAAHYARHYAGVNGLPHRALSPAALRRLVAHRWRGNVRELENTIHRAVLLAAGEMIEPDAIELTGQLPDQLPGELTSQASAAAASRSPQSRAAMVGRTMGQIEQDHILHTLEHTLGNRTHAAIILGISIRALRNKLRDYTQSGVRVPPTQLAQAAGAYAGHAA